jgi:hypothetical protein
MSKDALDHADLVPYNPGIDDTGDRKGNECGDEGDHPEITGWTWEPQGDRERPTVSAFSIIDQILANNKTNVAKILKNCPGAWQERGVSGMTPIIAALQENNTAMALLLAKHEPKGILLTDLYDDNAIVHAISWDNLELLKTFLSILPKSALDHQHGPDGNSYAHDAARNGQLRCLTYLAQQKPEILAKTNYLGETPTELAVTQATGRPGFETLKWLAENHPGTFRKENMQTGITPMQEVIKRKLNTIAALLLQTTNQRTSENGRSR